MNYYYRTKDGNGYLNLLQESDDKTLIKITEDEFLNRPDPVLSEVEQKRAELSEKISIIKQNLYETDYKAIKYAEGELTEDEYLPTKQQRKEWRAEINKLQEELDSIEQ